MAQPYIITGAAGTGVHPRIELRQLQKNPIQFSLFIQALIRLQALNDSPEKPNSWWQMGTIHGLPYEGWSGDPEGPQKSASDKWGGYCYHSAALFPTWHRVQLMLVEQAMVTEAIAVATELNNDKWLQAAKELRFPFWDWTLQETAQEGIPKICQQATIGIVQVDGTSKVVDNPLSHYKFAKSPGAAKNGEYMANWTRTYRWANKNDQPTEEMYDQQLKAYSQGTPLTVGGKTYALQPLHWLRGKVAQLFTFDLTVKDPAYGGNMWGYFSNDGAKSEGVDPVMSEMPPSLEEPHNMVHLDTGGNGSMSFNEYAGYDPMFYLHHYNVDRILAFWEYIYPNYRIGEGWKPTKGGNVTKFKNGDGSFSQPAGDTVDQNTPLIPFRKTASEYWTTKEVYGLLPNSPVNKYYTYPPIKGPLGEVKVDVPYDVNNLALRERYRQIVHGEFSPDFQSIAQRHQSPSLLSPLNNLLSAVLMPVTQGLANLRHFFLVGELPEFAFAGSYRLELYLLGVSGVSVVNSISVLGRSDPDRCAACRERRATGHYVRGHMPLDPRLILHLIHQLNPLRLAAIGNLTHLVALVHGSFGVRLVRPDGTQLAVAEPTLAAHLPVLEQSKMPALSLHSYIIKFNPTDVTAPIRFDGHMSHGLFGVDLQWRATA